MVKQPDNINKKAIVVIRSVGERTEQLCRELILAQGVVPANVVIVREAPFSAAMRKSFEIGLERDLSWTFCVDADLLLRPKSIETMLQLAEEQPENVCEIQGYILDKFFGGPRQGGVHLYRTSLLPKVIDSIPAEGVNVRPEFHTLQAMEALGHPWVSVPYLVGLHDFEQYYQDIFRKCFVQAHKHQYFTDLFLSIWRDGAECDRDYRVALKGYAKGIEYYEPVFIDTRDAIYQSCFAELQIEEKARLEPDEYSLASIEQIINEWAEPTVYQKQFPTKMGLIAPPYPQFEPPPSVKERWAEKKRQIGLMKMVPYTIGWAFKTIGARIQTWSEETAP